MVCKDEGPAKFGEIEGSEIADLQRNIAEALKNIREDFAVLRTQLKHYEARQTEEDSTWYVHLYDAQIYRSRPARLPQPRWQSVFQLLHYSDNKSFDYNDIYDAMLVHNFYIKKASLRPKIFFYIKKGYIERLSDGKFCLTREGLVYFGIYEG